MGLLLARRNVSSHNAGFAMIGIWAMMAASKGSVFIFALLYKGQMVSTVIATSTGNPQPKNTVLIQTNLRGPSRDAATVCIMYC